MYSKYFNGVCSTGKQKTIVKGYMNNMNLKLFYAQEYHSQFCFLVYVIIIVLHYKLYVTFRLKLVL